MSRTAVVAGATGLVGRALVRKLEQAREYAEVRVIGRRAPAPAGAKVRFVATDFADLSQHLAHSRMGPMHLHGYQGDDVTLILPLWEARVR